MHKRKSIAAIAIAGVLIGGGMGTVQYLQAKQDKATAALHKEIDAKNAQIKSLNKQVIAIQSQLTNEQQTNAATIQNLKDSINKINSQLPF